MDQVSENVVELRTDKQKADGYREELKAALTVPLEILNRAVKDGLNVNFNIGPNGFNEIVVQNITVNKPL